MKRTPLAVLSIACIATFGGIAAGCGGGDDTTGATDNPPPTSTTPVETTTSPATGSSTVEISADPQKLAFSLTTATASAGTVTLKMPNPSSTPHNIALQEPDTKGEVVGQGGVSEISVDLAAGTYTYYCSVPGHLEAGMKGTLTVQ